MDQIAQSPWFLAPENSKQRIRTMLLLQWLMELPLKQQYEAHQIHQNRTWNISATGGLVEIHIQPFQLQITAALVRASWVYAVLVTYNLHDINNTEVTSRTGKLPLLRE